MPGMNLTLEEAAQRSEVVEVDSYTVDLDLTTGDRVFRGNTTIVFDAQEGGSTFVDLVADKVYSVELNGQKLDVQDYQDFRFPLSDLKARNTLRVDADFRYMNSGEGMHRSVDPQDGKVYLYSQFEVPDARRVFPTFEQPNLKATFTFNVTVPEEWTVFSVSPTPVPHIEDGKATFSFAPTPRISTYITAVVAGPYEGRTGVIRSIDGREIDLGVYCRASLVEHLDANLIMEVTEQGFEFFENAYGIPYPFTKYDQIFVPEFNAGAMENAGCVTFRDDLVFRSKPTDWQLENRTNTILHELAHMWFGDLVTMDWWDDLWLNESFAEFMAHLATAEATRWSDAWVGFLGRKEWGLAQDQKPSTHPVKAQIRDLNDVEVNFDGITYAKGAAVLRQMVAYVGRENFFNAINSYLTKNAYGNAKLEDLLEELEAASGKDMKAWSKVWVEEAGVTTLKPELKVSDDGRIEELAVVQEVFTPGASLRPHALIVAGYDLGADGKVSKVFAEEVDAEGAATLVPGVVGMEVPDLVLVNDQDLAYAKVRLDEKSLDFAVKNITRFEDALTRRVLIAAAWDMTRDGEMAATDYLALALADLEVEDSIATTTSLLDQINLAVTSYVAPENRPSQLEKVASQLVQLANGAQPGSDQQLLLVKAVASRAVSKETYGFVEGLFNGSVTLDGLVVDIDLKWSLLFALVRGGLAGQDEIAALEAEDPTLTGTQNAARARATINSASVREETWAAIMTDVSIPNDTLWAMVAGFWSHAWLEPEQYLTFVEPFFAGLSDTWQAHTFHIASVLVRVMYPKAVVGYVPQANVVEQTTAWLEANTDQGDALRRLVTEARSDAERMLTAQACDAANIGS